MRGRSRCPLRAANAARVARVLSRRRSLAMLCAAGASFLTSLTDLCPSLLVLADRGSAEEEGGGCIDNFWRHYGGAATYVVMTSRTCRALMQELWYGESGSEASDLCVVSGCKPALQERCIRSGAWQEFPL